MRYGIFSDVHSNLEALEAVINAYKYEAIDKYLCVGDVVGYATNPNECIEKVKHLAMITVAGNHGWGSVDKIGLGYFTPNAKKGVFWTRQNLEEESRYFLEALKLTYQNEDLTLVHGTLDNPQEFKYLTDGYLAQESFKLLETRICFVGHTHKPGTFIQEETGLIGYARDTLIRIKDEFKYMVNVGSVGQPRDRNPQAAYCIYDTDKKEVQIKRINYDIEAARKKIISAGLPQYLGDRLLVGR